MSEVFSFPERPVSEIIAVLAQTRIADLRPEDLSNPTAGVLYSLYTSFISFVDPCEEDEPDGQIGFDALQLLDNPEHHVDAIRVFELYSKVKEMLASIQYENFTLRDLLKPEAKRTVHILSTLVNFIYYRDEKLDTLQSTVDKFPGYAEKKKELEKKIAELNKEIMDHEVARQLEEPIVQELDAEVKRLKLTIQNYNKQQMSLKTVAKGLKEKNEAITQKISQADFELLKNVQENSKLLPKIVQSPEKLQRVLEEKKAHRTEAKNSEKVVMESVQQKTAILGVYKQVIEKLSKHISQIQAMQEQVNNAKGVDRDVKACKAMLSEEAVSNKSLDAQIDEWQGKAKQVEELIKAVEKKRGTKHEQDSQTLESLRKELEWKLQHLEPREKAVEAMVAKGDNLCSEADSKREAGKVQQQQLLTTMEEIVSAFNVYTDMVDIALLPLHCG